MQIKSFNELPISPEVLHAIQDMGFEEPTPIQAESIPYILEGRDMLGQAQTGTGKTCAFAIPLIDRADPEDHHVQYLILSPTRELAIQIADEMHEAAKYKEGVRILAVYGGQPIDRQILALKKKPQIIVGTPGRVMDHMRRKTIRLDNLAGIILDEADEMLNMGFKEDIDTILASTPDRVQKVLFSATMPPAILELTDHYLADPVHVRITPREMTVSNIEQYYLEVRDAGKIEVLCRLIDTERLKLALIFCNTKSRVDDLSEKLQTRGYSAEALHGDMKQQSRTRVMNKFKKGEIELLVATDVAARGIDVDNIEAVINFDLPQDEEYYIHRIGRTGRAGRSGKAYTFVVGREIIDLKNIQRFTHSNIKAVQPPSLSEVADSRVGAVLDQVRTLLGGEDLSQYANAVARFVDALNGTEPDGQNLTAADVAAALLRQAVGANVRQADDLEPVVPYEEHLAARRTSSRPRAARPEQSGVFRKALLQGEDAGHDADADAEAGGESGAAKARPRRGKQLEPGMARLFINVGADDKVQPRQIAEAISSRSGLPNRQIGAIAVYARYAFVDVPQAAANHVVDSLTNQKIGSRFVRVEISGGAVRRPDRQGARTNARPAGRKPRR